MPTQLTKPRIVVLGYLIRGPLGGLAWHHLQYVAGLRAMGADVWFMEDSDDYPSCYDPERDVMASDATYGLAFAQRCFDRLGLGDRWSYYDVHDGWTGPAGSRSPEILRGTDIILNISGANPLRDWSQRVPVRVLVDTDPLFTQVRHLGDADWRSRSAAHTHFSTFALGLGSAGCLVPDDGFPWTTTRQPVVLDLWPVTAGPATARFTTVMQWDSYAPCTYGGREYGMKSQSFEDYVELPHAVREPLELALSSPGAPRRRLAANGWNIIDPRVPTFDPWTYQRYIQASKGEFAVAKHGYVASRSGWFSERSAVYLASGRPVIAQNTGFDEWIPTGSGLIAFQSPPEAADAIARVALDYERHCAAAREVAAEVFDSKRVLHQLLGRL